MTSQHLPRWVWASVSKHFDARRGSLPMYVEGHDRLSNPRDSLEFRLNGPDIQEVSRECFKVDVDVNILVMSIKDDADAHKVHKHVGVAAAAFENEIPVYKYGSGADDDPAALVGCLILETRGSNRIIVTHFGLVQGTNNILVATVEGHYKMLIK